MFVLDDAAQGFGATYKGRRLGSFGLATATSFFPAKPLGCYGDGGAIFTDDADLRTRLRSVRVHGQGSDKYDNVRLGLTGAARHHAGGGPDREAEDFRGRDRRAQRGRRALCARARQCRDRAASRRWLHIGLGAIHHPPAARRRPRRLCRGAEGAGHSDRDLLSEVAAPADAYRHFPVAAGGLPVSEKLSDEVISLPMHAYLDEPTQERIIKAVRAALPETDFAILRRGLIL